MHSHAHAHAHTHTHTHTHTLTGSSLHTILESMSEKVVVVVSADLAHTHDASGPYGYSNSSQPFDDVRISISHSTSCNFDLKGLISIIQTFFCS